MQRDAMLSGVRLFVVMIEFKKYQRSNNITADQFKTSFRKVVQSEKQKQSSQPLTENEKIKVD